MVSGEGESPRLGHALRVGTVDTLDTGQEVGSFRALRPTRAGLHLFRGGLAPPMAYETNSNFASIAKLVIALHGARSRAHVENMINALVKTGDPEGAALWRQIHMAVEDLEKMEPTGRVIEDSAQPSIGV